MISKLHSCWSVSKTFHSGPWRALCGTGVSGIFLVRCILCEMGGTRGKRFFLHEVCLPGAVPLTLETQRGRCALSRDQIASMQWLYASSLLSEGGQCSSPRRYLGSRADLASTVQRRYFCRHARGYAHRAVAEVRRGNAAGFWLVDPTSKGSHLHLDRRRISWPKMWARRCWMLFVERQTYASCVK